MRARTYACACKERGENAGELTKSRLYALYSTTRDLSTTYRDVRQNRADFLDAWLCTATSGKSKKASLG